MDAIETEKILTIAEMFEFLPAIDKIEQLKLVNSELQMHYDYARTECDELREELKELRLSYEVVVAALKEKE